MTCLRLFHAASLATAQLCAVIAPKANARRTNLGFTIFIQHISYPLPTRHYTHDSPRSLWSYNDLAGLNGSGHCGDATMPRDIPVGSSRR